MEKERNEVIDSEKNENNIENKNSDEIIELKKQIETQNTNRRDRR